MLQNKGEPIFRYSLYFLTLTLILFSCTPQKGERWSEEKIQKWYQQQGWLVGANFNPSSTINQLEFWQAETFDTEIIDRELGWAQQIGMNCMRVYLHHAVWQQNKEGFKNRVEQYLNIAASKGIKTIFVLFDDCWNGTFQTGKQPEPRPGVHNSGWVRDPGDLLFEKPELMDVLESYAKDVMTSFAADERILMWDVYNEPGNSDYGNKSLPLLQNVFQWGREVNPSQPLTSGVWKKSLKKLAHFQLTHSDLISYHNYHGKEHHAKAIDSLKKYKRPMICTEYMARTKKSTFQDILPLLKENHVAAINWGLVAGKSNTIYQWGKVIESGEEPDLWFHDIFRQNGTPYLQEEVDLIQELTK